MSTENSIKIVIIEDDETIRNGYAYLIGATPGYAVVNAYRSYEDAAKNLVNDQPDVILLDIELPGISGTEAIPKIKQVLPKTNIIVLTVYESEKIIFNVLSNGASGYLTKNTPAVKIIESIKEVMEGGGPMSVNIARMVIQSFQKNQQSPLTKRETQILEEIANGKSRNQIADELFIDLETVKTHIKNTYLKLGVHSRADAIKTAKENKLI
jgi:DNA-binding NarL/FixJ family response regulator